MKFMVFLYINQQKVLRCNLNHLSHTAMNMPQQLFIFFLNQNIFYFPQQQTRNVSVCLFIF